MTYATTIRLFFFFNDPAPTEIYTLPLHDALPIFEGGADRSYGIHVAELAGLPRQVVVRARQVLSDLEGQRPLERPDANAQLSLPLDHPVVSERSEEHTSELQSRLHLVCRLLLETK